MNEFLTIILKGHWLMSSDREPMAFFIKDSAMNSF